MEIGKTIWLAGSFFVLTAVGACGGSSGSSSPTVTTSQTPMTTAPATTTTDTTTQTPVEDLPVPSEAPSGESFHPSFKGWNLLWSDEFDGTELDRTKWAGETSGWGGGNNERQCYTDRERNVEIINGLLRLKAYPETFTGLEFPQDWPDRGAMVTQQYTSGKVRTRGLADWRYGRFEARAKLPTGQGTWPAFWMLPIDEVYGTWPLSGEIDIMEAVNLGATCNECEGDVGENRSSSALHFGNPFPDNASVFQRNTLSGGAEATDQYHVFAAEWGEGRINLFVNGVKFYTVDQDQWFTAAVSKEENINAPFDQAFYLIFNLAVGGQFPENTNENSFETSSFPSELLVDWVRVYECDFDEDVGRSCMDGE